MIPVVFNLALFLARYPEFSAVPSAQLTGQFAEAGLYLSNTTTGPVQDPVKLAMLLNMITAHICYIGGGLSADGQTRPVGRVSQASEGSVSASFEMNPPTAGTGAWWQQSQYGSAFWNATSSLRGFRYVTAPCNTNSFPYNGWPRG